ncbi:helix-turn-helix transcriptional regulator [Bordetella trematum]|uniref:helix-turn-helix transcriptional regulator n=1 Tax=Bordetella trematum TaxID=123899 RepID=UPI00126A01BE|nr:helix-turn-helix transcriptional regulator [Bordetella trematum]
MSQDALIPLAFRLLDDLYGGVASPEAWPQAVRGLGVALGGVAVSVLTHHRPSDRLSIVDAGTLPDGVMAGFQEMNASDPARAAASSLAAGHIYVDHEFHGEAALQRLAFYRDFLNPLGMGRYAVLPAGADAQYTHVVSVLREAGRGGFSIEERRLMRLLQPHLRHALDLRQQLSRWQARTHWVERSLDALRSPVLACSLRGDIVMANAAGKQWLAQADCPLGKGEPSRALRGLLRRACGEGVEMAAAGTLLLGPGEVLVALPLAPREQAGRDALALVAVQGVRWRAAVPGEMLRALFGLTPAESRLLRQLALHDAPLTEHAGQLQLSLNTLRTQLKAIFQKTHCRRQSDLLRLVDQLGLFGAACSADQERGAKGEFGEVGRAQSDLNSSDSQGMGKNSPSSART